MYVDVISAQRFPLKASSDVPLPVQRLSVTANVMDVVERWDVPIIYIEDEPRIQVTEEWNHLFGNDGEARRAFSGILYRVLHEELMVFPSRLIVDDSLWNSGHQR